MNVSIKTAPEFDRRAKRLAKKYKSLKGDLQTLIASLNNNPLQGTSLGMGGVYKVRMAIASKGGGKSGGSRVITFAIKVNEPDIYEVTLLSIYDKSEIQNVSNSYIASILKEIL